MFLFVCLLGFFSTPFTLLFFIYLILLSNFFFCPYILWFGDRKFENLTRGMVYSKIIQNMLKSANAIPPFVLTNFWRIFPKPCTAKPIANRGLKRIPVS